MFNKYLLLLLLFTISITLFSSVEKGLIDLSEYDFDNDEPVDLSGYWDLTLESGEKSHSYVPGSWETGKGSVKYSIKIISTGTKGLILALSEINTEFKFYLNSQLISEDDQNRSNYIPITLKKGENRLDFYIKNYTEKIGGFRSPPYIGKYEKIIKKYEGTVLRDTFISGASFVMFLFFFILYINYRNDKATLVFSFICLSLSIRGLVTNDKVIFNYIPNLSYLILKKLEYFSAYSLPVFIFIFIYFYFDKKIFSRIYKVAILISSIFVIAVIFTKPLVFISMVYWFDMFIPISSMLMIITLILYAIKREAGAIKILISIIILGIAGIVDSINYIVSSFDFQLLPVSMLVFILFMSIIVSQREIRMIKKIDKLSDENIKVIKYLSKFVPNAFIKTVGMGNITTIKRGDGVDKNMTVLFSSIIGFQQELKLYKAEDTVQLLNRCFKIISPIISAYGGFIDKFIDETVMALFPGKPEDAIDAVLEINRKLEEFNKNLGYGKPLKMRSGIHNGSQFIGIVGDNHRVDATVISKVVNTASRINSFTEKIEREILISDDVFITLSNPDKYKTMYMGRVKLKGKMNFIRIHCIYPNKVNESDNLFSITMKKLEDSSLDKIENVLLNIKHMSMNHGPTNYYLDLIKKNRRFEDFEK